ncbi:MAG: hypothetical protein HUK24_02075, partial [Sphaerochaetaceae bacterium]|nr:hypothetical protein [Sphaerochaetaceae bacterium]
MKKVTITMLLLVLCFSTLWANELTEQSIASFDGKKIGVQTAVLYEELIMDKVPNTQFQYYTMPTDMIAALSSGKISAYLIEQVGFG